MDSSGVEGSAGVVLLVEDDVDVREAIADILSLEKFDVLRATDGQQALRQLREAPELPDVVLLDLMMPVMDGWQFRLEQRRDPRLAAIPVVALSADRSARAQAVDADAFLSKPVDGGTLVRTVRDLVLAARARKQEAERLAHSERLSSLGQMAAAVAHEINNPLSWVVGNLRILADRLEHPERLQARLEDTRAAVREALEGAERIRAIVSDIRVFTRKFEDEAATVDVVDAIESLLRLMDRQLQPRVRIVREFNGAHLVRASPGRLRQVLLNLVVNALEALPQDRVPDENVLRLRVAQTRDRRVEISVTDNGPGIPPAVLQRVFEPFFTTKGKEGGTGLGLFVCQGLVTAMGGELRVQTEVGRGARFSFSLPRAEPLGLAAPGQAPASGRRMTILAVDEDPAVLTALAGELQGDLLLTAHDGEAALQILASQRVDLILCDLHSRKLDGRALYYQLHRQGGGLETKLAFMTGGILDEEMLRFAKSRSDRVLQKPLRPTELRSLRARLERTAEGMKRSAV